MICRMNKKQRKALIDLIDAKIENHRSGCMTENINIELEATRQFHKAFRIEEKSEDSHDHTEDHF